MPACPTSYRSWVYTLEKGPRMLVLVRHAPLALAGVRVGGDLSVGMPNPGMIRCSKHRPEYAGHYHV
jgi:hypothetical protein